MCDRLAALGLEVVCPDLFHRTAGAAVLPETDEGRTAGFAALRDLTADDLTADVRKAASLLAKPIDQCHLVGLSVGGYVGFLVAARMPFKRVALAYPGWLASPTPPIAHRRPALDELDAVTGQLLVVVGGDDSLITPDEQRLLAERLTAHDLMVLPGVGHGFLCPTRPSYQPEAAARAWDRIATHVCP